MTPTRRLAVGALLGILWFAVLLIPEFTRRHLLAESAGEAVVTFVLMLATSALMSLFLGWLMLQRRLFLPLGCVLVLPFLGAIVFAELTLFVEGVFAVLLLLPEVESPLRSIPSLLVGAILAALLDAPLIGLVTCMLTLHVTLPMSLVHVWAMRRSGRCFAPVTATA